MRVLVQDAVALARTHWKDDAGGHRRLEIAADLEPVARVRGDAAVLAHAIGHLVRNALDAMPGGGRLVVRLRPRRPASSSWSRTPGRASAEDVRPRMFDPFFTTRASDAPRPRAHHGPQRDRSAAAVASTSRAGAGGRGTAVSVWLPAASGATRPALGHRPRPARGRPPSPPEPSAGAQPSADAAPLPRGRASILVLEDEEPVRAMLVQALTEAGHEVHAAADGPAGQSKIEQGCFDVVLTDARPAAPLWPRRRARRQAREPEDPRRLDHGLGSPARSRAAPRARGRPHARQAVPPRAGHRDRRRGAAARRLRLSAGRGRRAADHFDLGDAVVMSYLETTRAADEGVAEGSRR